MTIEIPQKSWKHFCEAMNSQHDLLMDIRVQGGGDTQLVAQAAPLHSITFDDTGDACNNSLAIEFSSNDQGPSRHEIIEPIRLILRKESDGDHYNFLEIPAEGGTTVVIFHPGISPALLGELELPLPHAAGQAA
jgi:hypothetical protein